jgi:DNA-binding MarR family transcriptional regulator
MPDEKPWYDTVVLPALLRHARTTYGRAMRRALAQAGCDDVPKNGLYVIGGLAMGAGGVPLSVLVRDLDVSKQAAGQLVDTLVLRGYLERAPDPEDRRRLTVTLTPRGQAAAAAQATARDRIDAELLARVGEKHVKATRATLAALIGIGRDAGEEDDDH